ncbi:MAG: hypothetical protein KAI99_19650, partial [Cyclobacteriaceae bacterium]|nr:hypothetical protein [Cyclobacteriaceae bacterium]
YFALSFHITGRCPSEVIQLIRFDLLSPVQAIKMRMKGLGLKPKDLVNILGDKSRVSDILSMKRKLTLGMIRNLNKALNIPIETLVQEY